MTEVIAGVVYFFGVFAKAFQQRNVAFLNYRMIPVISYILAASDVTWIAMTAFSAIDVLEGGSVWQLVYLAFCIGTGGALGAISAMWLHHKHFTHARFK